MIHDITRDNSGDSPGRSGGTSCGGFVWAVGDSENAELGIYDQTHEALAMIDETLLKLGSDKTRLVSATVYLTDIGHKPEMDRAWCEWIGSDPAHWPQRACVGVQLVPGTLVEIVVLAARMP